ncbi:MAG: AMP-binding protein [Burkholderiaceae bacterium]
MTDSAYDPLNPLRNEPATVYAALQASALKWPNSPMLVVPAQTATQYDIEATEVSYREALNTVDGLAASYRAAGWQAGHRIGLLLENRPDFFWHWLALNALGVSVVPINADFRDAELQYLIDDAGLAMVVSLPSHHDLLRAAAATTGRTVIVTEPLPSGPMPPAPAARVAGGSAPGLSTECALLYTSGTTGAPKGCILPNEYYLYAAVSYREAGGVIPLREGQERLLSPLPLVHMNAMACSSVAMILTGGAIILLDRFHPSSWWDTVRESKATIIHYLGVMPAMLLRAPASDQDKKHQVRFGFGAGVSRTDHEAFEQRFGFVLMEGWAMTETGMGGCIMANHEPRKVGTACFGQLPAGVQARVINDAGVDCEPDEPGELWVRRDGVDPSFGFFKGYLNKEAATAEAWAHGWFHTGDIVQRDSDGDFHFIDRRKNVIRRSGENIAAVEVEAVLMQHDAVAACGVAPVPDEIRGDEVMACLKLTDSGEAGANQQELARDIMQFALARLAYFKAPGYIAFVAGLPLTATQKVKRGELKELANACASQSVAGEGPALASFDLRNLKKRNG